MTREEAIRIIENRDGIMDYCENQALSEALDMAIEALENEECEDCISRKEALKLFEDRFIELQKVHQKDKQYGVNWCINTLKDLPSVNPQEPRKDEVILTKKEYGELVSSEFDNGYAKGYREALEQEQKTGHCKDCKWWKDSDGAYRRGIGAESQCPMNRKEVFEGNGYCYMFKPQESEEI